MLVFTEADITLLPKIIVLNPKDGYYMEQKFCLSWKTRLYLSFSA